MTGYLSDKDEILWKQLQEELVFLEDGTPVVSYWILDTLLRCQIDERTSIYTHLNGKTLTLYQCLMRLLLSIHLILIFKQKEEDIPELLAILKESEEILIAYAGVLFRMKPGLMFLWTIFLNYECYSEDDDFSYHFDFIVEKGPLLYGMDNYFLYIFSESFFQSYEADPREHPILRLILEHTSFMKYAVPKSHFMTPSQIKESMEKGEYPAYMEHLHPCISWAIPQLMELCPDILSNHEMYLYIYANRTNKELILYICNIYKDKHPSYILAIYTAVRGQYKRPGEDYMISTKEGLALSVEYLIYLLNQSDDLYRGDEVEEQVSKIYAEYNPCFNNYVCDCNNNNFVLTRMSKQEAGIECIHTAGRGSLINVNKESELYSPLVMESRSPTCQYLFWRDRDEVSFMKEKRVEVNANGLPFFDYHFIPSTRIWKSNRDDDDKVYVSGMRDKTITTIRNRAFISLSDTFVTWRGVPMVPKVSYLPYSLMSELYDRADRSLYDQLVNNTYIEKEKIENDGKSTKKARLKKNHLMEGILKYARTMPYYIGNPIWNVFSEDKKTKAFVYSYP